METILYLLANIYVSVVCKVAIKQYCFFFCSFVLCARQVLANSNYVMGGPMDTIQLLFNSLLVDIHSSGASNKPNCPSQNAKKMEFTLGKRRRIHDKKKKNNKRKNDTKRGGKEAKD